MLKIASLTKTYNVKGVLTNADMKVTEIKKDGIFTHDLAEALKLFEGEEVSISITLKQEVSPELDE